jgi:hypothetical protein
MPRGKGGKRGRRVTVRRSMKGRKTPSGKPGLGKLRRGRSGSVPATTPKLRPATWKPASKSVSAPSPPAAMFARHETFTPRYGWLTKGYQAAVAASDVFLADDAPLTLGVGKNMARSIRYWCHAFKVLKPADTNRSPASVPTDLGRALFAEPTGWDPFLEDPASLWLLHWSLIAPPCQATAWEFAFTHFGQSEFTAEHLVTALQAYVARSFPLSRISPSSLRKDVNCILRMYGESPAAHFVNEETLACPFVELGLIRKGQASRTYYFDVGEKESLSPEIIVAACLQYAATTVAHARTIPAFRLLSDPGSPGMAFKLTESALCAAIETVAAREPLVGLSHTAGLLQMTFQEEGVALAHLLLRGLFARHGAAA